VPGRESDTCCDCEAKGPVCEECLCCEDCCDCDDGARFDRDELGVDPELDTED
jgi:hypothetical protein